MKLRNENVLIFGGGSGIGKTAARLQPYVEGAEIVDAQVNLPLDAGSLKEWADKIGLR
jgi:NAD(P)-dependent dehydrogenase (short-subunit alcohol dehydrogenase family)